MKDFTNYPAEAENIQVADFQSHNTCLLDTDAHLVAPLLIAAPGQAPEGDTHLLLSLTGGDYAGQPAASEDRKTQLLADIQHFVKAPSFPVLSSTTRVRTAAQRIEAASNLPPLVPLFGCLWETPGIAILAGDTGVGKSILAVHIGHLITSSTTELLGQVCYTKEKVLYYDFELTDRQFSKRFADMPFTEDLMLGDTNPVAEDVEKFTFEHIAADLDRTGAQVLILDNITALALTTTADADVSIGIMKGLKRLQTERGVSSLVLAHTPKLPAHQPLSLNDLAGSKHLSNFADSVFFIARSTQGTNVRYIKQLKNRTDKELEGVIVCEINDEAGYLAFKHLGADEETAHLAAGPSKGHASASKTPAVAVLAELPALLQEPQFAKELEEKLATLLGKSTRTVRDRLCELTAPDAETLLNSEGQLCRLVKEQDQADARKIFYSLCPVEKVG
jgi:hypothetical protein